MKPLLSAAVLLALAGRCAFALDGQTGCHDPSTAIACNGKYYVYATGGNSLVSDDGWTWRRGTGIFATLPGGRPGQEVLQYAGGNQGSPWAPDVLKVGDTYYMYYALSGQQHRAVVGMMSNKTLDQASPDYKWQDGGPITWSLGDGQEDLHAIDPGAFYDASNNAMWIVYGSYFGTIRIAQLDPKTGKRLNAEQSKAIVANQSEAPILIAHEGWYYLLTNHGTCCAGASSTYNIRVGRAKTVTGPYLDDHGIDMARGGGKLFAASGDRHVGPGHFGLLDLGDGVQRFSCHYEADLDRGGASVLDIRPLLWRDGWPVAGENIKEGTYQVKAKYSGTVLELGVQGTPLSGGRGRGGGVGARGGARGDTGRGGAPGTQPGATTQAGPGAPGGTSAQAAATPPQVIPNQEPSPRWPAGEVEVRMAAYLLQAQQKWMLSPVPNAGGYPGSPYFKITVAGTTRTLAATPDDELIALPAFTGEDAQLWRIDQLADNSYRIMPKSAKNRQALTSIGRSGITLSPFEVDDEHQRWLLELP